MKRLMNYTVLGLFGTATCLLVGLPEVRAQDRPPQGAPDAAQMRQRMLERMKDRFEVQDDAEWKVISDRLTKVMEARRGMGGFGGFGGPGGMGGPGGPPPGGGPGGNSSGGSQGSSDQAGGSRGGPGGMGGPPGMGRQSSPELEALNKAIESKAASSELKNKLEAVRAARKKQEAALTQAQENLRQVLSARQEAIAVSMGLLN
jgi:hypothetical protein